MTASLTGLVERAFAARDRAMVEDPDVVVDPAVPILYFGDLPAYRRSPLRIVTVGLNPSRVEFPAKQPFTRFPAAGRGPDGYLAALDDYFRTDPYLGWFNTFTSLLAGLGASFADGEPNRALHTDIGSPVATDPTWSKLSPAAKARLGSVGTPLWHDLVRELRPHAIVASVARPWLNQVTFEPAEPWWDLHVVAENRVRPYVVKARHIQVTDGHTALVVWGPAGMTPFQLVTHTVRRQIGQKIKEALT